MRQVYQACVTAKLDYASTVWHNPLKDKGHLKALGTVQRTALIRILLAFRTVATQTLEVECYVTPTRLRLKQRAQNVIASLSTLPHDHPIKGVLERMKSRVKRKKNHPKFPFAESMRTMDINQLGDLETIDPRPLEPWRQPVFDKIDIEIDREAAIQKATYLLKTSETVIYTDASAKDLKLGAVAVILSSNGNARRS